MKMSLGEKINNRPNDGWMWAVSVVGPRPEGLKIIESGDIDTSVFDLLTITDEWGEGDNK